jgi:tRNA U34 5-methylaminomethyl-2-thiouridine-forming methyltransferase MnmC
MKGGYRLVMLPNGVTCVRSEGWGETLHPGIGPAAEAEALYARQLRLRERMEACRDEFVLWDVGLGAAANVSAVLQALRGVEGTIHVVSFDETLEPLRFALAHAAELAYFADLREVAVELAAGARRQVFRFGALQVVWELVLGDFPSRLTAHAGALPAPHGIMFDAFSPRRNPAMWTLPLFERLHGCLDPARPCALSTYSRSTMLRVTLLLAGFLVGVGRAAGAKEETTVAANRPDLIDVPLDRRWLERALRSHGAEPLREARWTENPLSPTSRDRLSRHEQFQVGERRDEQRARLMNVEPEFRRGWPA